MNRDLDVLTLLLLDPCLTTDEATREAAATTNARKPDRAAPVYPATKPIAGRERPRWAESAACE